MSHFAAKLLSMDTVTHSRVVEQDCFYTLAQTAAILGVSVVSVRRLVGDGSLPAVDVGRPGALRRRWRVSARTLDRWLLQRESGVVA